MILLSLFTCNELFSQVNTKLMYVVFTFETEKNSTCDKQVFYWITLVDSIENKLEFNIYPLFTQEYSKDVIDSCIKGDSVDVFLNTTNSNFEFGENYETQIKYLMSIVNNNKTKVQTVVHMRSQGGIKETEIVKVYATPVIGEFCDCMQCH